MHLEQTTIDDFQRDGAVVLRGVFTDWIDTLQAGVASNMADPGPYGREYTKSENSGRFFGDYCNWDRIPEYRDFVFNSPAASIAAQLVQSQTIRFFSRARSG